MAHSGVVVVCSNIMTYGGASLAGRATWTETPAVNTPTQVAPSGGSPNMEVRTFTGDIWFAIGTDPDPVNGPRWPLKVEDGARNMPCGPGDKFRHVAA